MSKTRTVTPQTAGRTGGRKRAQADALADSPCSCFRLRRAARRLSQAYDQALRPAGLRGTQYSLLSHVLQADGLSVTELAERMAMERTTLTRNLRPLQKAGLLRIEAGPDRRSRAVRITAQGRKAFEAAQPLWRAAERNFRRQMGRDQVAALHRLLDQAAASVSD